MSNLIKVLLAMSFSACYVFGGENDKPQESKPKYELGISIDDAKKIMIKDYPVIGLAIADDEDAPRPTEQEKQEEPRWHINVTDEKIALYFNSYRKLIGTRSLKKEQRAENAEKETKK